MSSKSKVTSDTRRRTLIGLAGLAASASAGLDAQGRASLPDRGGRHRRVVVQGPGRVRHISNSPATKRLRDDGATFIGREIDFITEEKVII